jgi:monomeric isocitrate dehydrogenase
MREVKHTGYRYYDWRCDKCKAHFEMSVDTTIEPALDITRLKNDIQEDIDFLERDHPNEYDEGKIRTLQGVLVKINKFKHFGIEPKSLDITGSDGVEIKVRNDGTVLWVNTVEGGCVLRICRIKEIVVEDERKR